MSQKSPAKYFKWVEDVSPFTRDLIEVYNEDSNESYFLEVDVQYPKKLHDLRNDLPFFPERMKIIEKIEKLVPNVYDKEVHVIDKRNIKQTLSHGLVLKKEQRAINFNQIAWLKSNTDINTEVRKNAKQDFEKDFLRW